MVSGMLCNKIDKGGYSTHVWESMITCFMKES